MAKSSTAHVLGWAVRTALRDARGSRVKAMLYALGMALGMGALVAMGSFGADMDAAIGEQTRTLLGADLTVMSRQQFSEATRDFIAKAPGKSSHQQSFVSMALFEKQDSTQLVRVRAVEAEFPFYGELKTTPVEAAKSFRDGAFVLADKSLLDRVEAEVGDRLRLGETWFTIAGRLEEVPGESAAASMMGPRLYMPLNMVEGTGLIRQNSRVFYSQSFLLPSGVDPDAYAEEHQAFFKQERLTFNTVTTRKQSLGESLGNLTNFLNVVACLALLLGGLGVAGAVHYHLNQKVRQIAVLRCMGATVKQVMSVYLIQVALMALAAIVAGTVLGLGIQFYLPRLVADLLPFSFEPSFHLGAVLIAAAWGMLMSMLLAAAPLAAVRRISPMASFRPQLTRGGPDRVRSLLFVLVVLSWWAFAIYRTNSLVQGSWFIGGLLAGIGALYLTARLLGWCARSLISPKLPFVWRHGLANLFRPHNQTSVFLIILGMGIFLITVLSGSRTMLLSQFQGALVQERANFIAFDIQADQVEGVRSKVDALGFPIQDLVPIVPMRISSINGTSVADMADGDIPDWTLQREYRSTYRDMLSETEELVAGEFIASVDADAQIIPITLEDDIAETLKVKTGDRMEMDVLGIPLQVEVVGLRKVDWQSMQPNFFMLFPTGILEQAPQMYVLTTRTESPERVAQLQRALVDTWPNVSCMDLTLLVANIDRILEKAVAVVQFLAGLCVLTGFVLLASAIWNSRYERLGEHALLRTLGAVKGQLTRIILIEYFLLGLFAAFTGLVLAVAANWALGTFLFKVPPFPEPLAMLPPIILLPFFTLSLGYISLRSVRNAPPRLVLKQEGM